MDGAGRFGWLLQNNSSSLIVRRDDKVVGRRNMVQGRKASVI